MKTRYTVALSMFAGAALGAAAGGAPRHLLDFSTPYLPDRTDLRTWGCRDSGAHQP